MRTSFLNITKQLGGLKVLNHLKCQKDLITVLCFHRVNDYYDPFFPSIKPKIFKELINYIQSNCSVITLDDLALKTSKPKVVITFDDGYKDFIENALPILASSNTPAIHGIVYNCAEYGHQIWTQDFCNVFNALLKKRHQKYKYKGSLGTYTFYNTEDDLLKLSAKLFPLFLRLSMNSRYDEINIMNRQFQIDIENEAMMNWGDIIECSKNNIEIASHTMSHEALPFLKDDQLLKSEVVECKINIEKRINKELRTIAFPNGLYDDNVVNITRQGGYKYLLGLNDNFASVNEKVIERMAIYHESLLENKFRVEGLHNMVKAPFRKIKKVIC